MNGKTQQSSMHRVVIVGAGFGGLNAAEALAGAPVRITVIDRKNYHTFQPLLYQVATAGLSAGEIASPVRSILSRHKNVEVLMAEVTAFDLERRMVQTTDSEIPYDSLIVAAGASHAYFGHDEWQAFAPGLKTIEDALEIRRRVLLAFELAERRANAGGGSDPLNFVVVGAGPPGSNSQARLLKSAGMPSPMISVPSIPAAPAFISSKAARMFCPHIPRIFRAARSSNCNAWASRCSLRRW